MKSEEKIKIRHSFKIKRLISSDYVKSILENTKLFFIFNLVKLLHEKTLQFTINSNTFKIYRNSLLLKKV